MLEIAREYLSRHRNSFNIILHLIGIPLVVIGIVQLFMAKWGYGAMNFFLGYTMQWMGHIYFEKNEFGEIYLLKKLIRKIRTKDQDGR